MNRLLMVSGTVLAFAFAVAMQQGCSSSDSGSGGSGNTTSTGGAGNATSTGGTGNVTSTGGTGNATSTGGTGTSGSTATGGTSTAGMSSGGTGGVAAGGASASGTGGVAAGGTSGGGTGGAAAGGTSGGGGALMACASGVAKNTPCTDSCAKTCGLKGVGATKAETCTGAPLMYMEGACTYPPGGSYACYHKTLPLMACPGTDAATGPTSGTTTCTSAECTPCGPAYQSSSGAKMGACVCVAGVYQCASDAEWPPQ